MQHHSMEGLLAQMLLGPTPEFQIQWVWDGTFESAFLTSSQGMLPPQVWEAYLEKC